MINYFDIGAAVKKQRERVGMTQAELGEKIGVTGVTIMRYEKGLRSIKAEQLINICDALGVSVPYMLGLTTNPEGLQPGRSYDPAEFKAATGVDIDDIDWKPLDEDLLNEIQLIAHEKRIKLDRINAAFNKLNSDGQNVAAERVEELTEIPKYQAAQPAPGEGTAQPAPEQAAQDQTGGE